MTELSRRRMLGALPAAAIAASTMSFLGSENASGQDSSEPATEKSLYERLGGYDAISAVVEEFANRLFTDPKIKHFFRGMGTDTKESFKQKNKNLLSAVTGGPAKIISRPAKTAHAGLNITQGDFNVVAGHLKAALEKFKVPERETKEVFAIIGKLQPDIVQRKTEKLSRDIDD
jgi:hemoglobin